MTRNRRSSLRLVWLLPLLVLVVLGSASCTEPTGSEDATETDTGPDTDADTTDPLSETGDETGISDDAGDAGDPDCIPDPGVWDDTVEPLVDEYCGDCHGETPQHGAPHTLTDYDTIVDGPTGDRKVDAMAREMIARDMPPPGAPTPGHADLDTLVAWASCGAEHPDYGAELEASAPVWDAPEEAPEGLDYFDIAIDEFEVGPDVVDDYRCTAIEVPLDDERLIRRIEPIIDDSRVLHHSLVSVDRSQSVDPGEFSCPLFPPGDDYLYAWGPGQSGLEFDEGGIRIGPDDRMVMQIHYNNGAGFEDVSDSSGLRIYYQETDATEYAMDYFETMSIDIPPESTADATTSCTVVDDVELVATWPHMHEIGSEFEQTVTRSDGTEETVVELTGWHFEAQYLYETPMQLEAGDEMTMTCTWDNPHQHSVSFGTGTEDEMCFSFMYFESDAATLCQ